MQGDIPDKAGIRVTLNLTVAEVEVILNGLQELPYRQVAALFAAIHEKTLDTMQAAAEME